MGREREERATEAGVLAEVVQQAVEAKRARPQHFSVLLVRLLQPKDKPSASVMRAAAAKAAAEARAAAEAAAEAARAEVAAAAVLFGPMCRWRFGAFGQARCARWSCRSRL